MCYVARRLQIRITLMRSSIRIRVRIKGKSLMRIQIRIRIKVKGEYRILMKVMQIRKPSTKL